MLFRSQHMRHDNDHEDGPIICRDAPLENLYDIGTISNDIEDRFLTAGPVKTLKMALTSSTCMLPTPFTRCSAMVPGSSHIWRQETVVRVQGERALCLRARNYRPRGRLRNPPSGAWRAIRASVASPASSYDRRSRREEYEGRPTGSQGARERADDPAPCMHLSSSL